jgi:hypothetical protein
MVYVMLLALLVYHSCPTCTQLTVHSDVTYVRLTVSYTTINTAISSVVQ